LHAVYDIRCYASTVPGLGQPCLDITDLSILSNSYSFYQRFLCVYFDRQGLLCSLQVHADSLRHSLLRINTYRALASPAWISLTSPDPILSAFQLSWELEHLALRENEFKDSYLQLSNQCKKYACDLLEQCRSSEEVIAVLNKVLMSVFFSGVFVFGA
jgi:hypothetical protein